VAKINIKSVDEYIATQPLAARAVLERVRNAIRKAVPAATEVISYQIPTYKLSGGPVLFFAGWKKHYSLYPASERIVRAFEDELKAYTVRKGTIRFPLDQPVPVRLIAGIAKLRATEVAERAKATRNPLVKSP
jgi:uncharacterized protein YdhG (YjbR/CyaY superfamily)